MIDAAVVPAGAPPIRARIIDPGTGVVRNRSVFGQVLLLRLGPGDVGEASATRGIVAFSAICTHAGCVVTGWMAAERRLLCPCHGSVYDPAARGRVVAGPAPRALPALPLRLDGDSLIVAGSFTARVGASTGRTD